VARKAHKWVEKACTIPNFTNFILYKHQLFPTFCSAIVLRLSYFFGLACWKAYHVQTPLNTMHTTPYTNSSHDTAHNSIYKLLSRPCTQLYIQTPFKTLLTTSTHCTQLHIMFSCGPTFTYVLGLVLLYLLFVSDS